METAVSMYGQCVLSFGSKPKPLLVVPLMVVKNSASINVMPLYPLIGQLMGIIWWFD